MPSAERSFPEQPHAEPREVIGLPLRVGVVGGQSGIILNTDHETTTFLLAAVRAEAERNERLLSAMESPEYKARYASASHRLRALEEALTEVRAAVLAELG